MNKIPTTHNVPVTACKEPAKTPPEMVERATTGRPVATFLARFLKRGKRPLPDPAAGTTGAAAAAAGARKRVKSGEGSRLLLSVWGCRLRLAGTRGLGVGRSRTKAEAWARRNARARRKESARG